MCVPYYAIIEATSHNSTTEKKDEYSILKDNEEKTLENKLGNSNNKTLQGLVEELYDRQTYNLSTCKNVLKNNLKGSFNLSLHDIICKYLLIYL